MSQLNSGPPQNPNRRRRNATVPMAPLPAEGRQGPAPAWPLDTDITTRAKWRVAQDKVDELEELAATGKPVGPRLTRARERATELTMIVEVQADRELAMWRELWATPQAVMWERLGWVRDVAQFVRWKVLGESGDMDAAKEARQHSDRLGLSPLAMLRLRWEIVDQPAVRTAAPTADGMVPSAVTDISSRRARLS